MHAGTTVELLCRLEEPADGEPAALVIEVADHHPARGTDDRTARTGTGTPEYGRGLQLVGALAERWGVTYRAGLKTVWSRLPVDGLGRPARVPGAEPALAARAARRRDPRPRAAARRREDPDWVSRGALSFLAEASDLLAGQLDEDMVAALAGQLLVPRLADWCAIWLESEGGGTAGTGGPRGRAAARPRLARRRVPHRGAARGPGARSRRAARPAATGPCRSPGRAEGEPRRGRRRTRARLPARRRRARARHAARRPAGPARVPDDVPR